jgi:hypothetical protein
MLHRFCVAASLLCCLLRLPAQSSAVPSTAWLVILDVKTPAGIARCYTPESDQKRVRLSYSDEDTLALLSEFALSEDPLEGPDCFVPELKLIFETHTYVLSLYCSKVLKYENSAPHTPSSRRIANDLVMTPGLHAYLARLRRQHFPGMKASASLLRQVRVGDPVELAELNAEVLELLLDEPGADEDLLPAEQEQRRRILHEEREPDEDGDGGGR